MVREQQGGEAPAGAMMRTSAWHERDRESLLPDDQHFFAPSFFFCFSGVSPRVFTSVRKRTEHESCRPSRQASRESALNSRTKTLMSTFGMSELIGTARAHANQTVKPMPLVPKGLLGASLGSEPSRTTSTVNQAYFLFTN